jgi:hypothetical protein
MQFEDGAPEIAGVAEPQPVIAVLRRGEAWVLVGVQRAVGFELEATWIKSRLVSDAL